ncbi:carboxylesterase family protein [Actinomadura sp. KC345]|uniref:carboxylesterase/lipase family protein n=1 Tax=Actinomadura sp. KC345 TaxID=2530371 RepID=UPI0010454AA8|nr:carboxylesterase family protein [Actinomadura sp. KC345]TDC55344.1 carboxylesterase family protein [Actinomadura sp. KC345]
MIRRDLVHALTAVFAGLAVAALGLPAPPAAAHDPSLVRVDSGWVRGDGDAGHVTFSGIPYAAPPVGGRRWRPPAPPERWRGVHDATGPAEPCPQTGFDDQGAPIVVGREDCLTVDVVRPLRGRSGGPLPVIVWLHGGELDSGAAAEYDGARLAEGGDVVVVTVNYRLGALGFLSSPALDAEGTVSGNYGLLDQAEALRWVRRNISRFGGDPRRVTLAGQSAGARSVCTHLASPGSRGLFHRAVTQSGACTTEVKTKTDADANGAQAIEEVGCADAGTGREVTACLRDVPAGRLLDVLGDVGHPLGDRRDAAWAPVAGTPYLPWQPAAALRGGLAADVPLLLGSTRHEARGTVLGSRPDLTADEYAAMLRTLLGADSAAVLEEYPAAEFGTPALALAAVVTDRNYACPALSTARAARPHMPVYAYEFREERQPVDGVSYGAHHSWDLPFLFDTSIPGSQFPPLTRAQRRLSATMIDYWPAFARTGDPNGPGRPAWPVFGTGTGSPVIGLSTHGVRPVAFGAEHRCEFWAGS